MGGGGVQARRADQGSLLIITLWIVLVLSMLAVAIGRYLSIELQLVKYRIAREQAKAFARGGIYLAMQRLADDAQQAGEPYDWLGDDWASFPSESGADPSTWVLPIPPDGLGASPPAGALRIRITDEERKLNLNDAATPLIARLLENEAAAQAFVDYRDADADGPSENLPEHVPPYVAKNAPIVSLAELANIPGLPPEALEPLRQWGSCTLPSASTTNLNTVGPEVLRAAGVGEGAIGLIQRFREGADGPAAREQGGIFTQSGIAVLQTLKDHAGVDLTGTPDGNVLASARFGTASQTFTIIAEAVAGPTAASTRVEAVVRRKDCGQGRPEPCIIAWREL